MGGMLSPFKTALVCVKYPNITNCTITYGIFLPIQTIPCERQGSGYAFAQ